MEIMRILGDMETLSKTAALKIIERQLGFPKPSSRFLHWYFICENQEYVPVVDFNTLAIEIKEKGIVEMVATVVGLPPDDAKKNEVLRQVQKIIQKHRIEG
jgi:hypothetical protein